MKSRYTAVSIEERMDPGKAVMRCRRYHKRIYSMIRMKTINVAESFEKLRKRTFTGPDMAPDLDRPLPNLSRDDLYRFACFIICATKLGGSCS